MAVYIFAITGKVGQFNKDEISLEEAQQLVGGYVTLVQVSPTEQILVDEDAMMTQKVLNSKASARYGQPLLGDVVVLTDNSMWGPDEDE